MIIITTTTSLILGVFLPFVALFMTGDIGLVLLHLIAIVYTILFTNRGVIVFSCLGYF